MGPHKELCLVFMGTLLCSFLLLYESTKLEGYKFPVYSTKFCPRNQTEWNERSSALNCNESNGYMCLPNEHRTELLELCYTDPFAWVEEGVCLYLVKGSSKVNGYNCVHFVSGCPTSSHMSSKSYKYQSCFAIGKGCFTSEPSCNSTAITTSLVETTTDYTNIGSGIMITTLTLDTSKTNANNDREDVTINLEYNTTKYTGEFTEDKDPRKDNTWVTPLAILGIFIPVYVICMLSVCVYYKKGRAAKKRIEGKENEERKPFMENQNEMEAMESGHASSNNGLQTSSAANDQLISSYQNTHQEKKESIQKGIGSNQESALARSIFKYWQQENMLFVPTKAFQKVENLIKKQNLVIVVGNSGSGKSAILQHIALKYRSQGWVVKPVTEVKKVMTAYTMNNILENETLFVLNDPIGKQSFDKLAYSSWKKNEKHLKACLKKFKMLISCRKCVQSDKRAKGLFKKKSNIVDINADDCKLSNDEKLKIWNKYKCDSVYSEIDLTKILKIDAYFPLLCKLFFSDKENQKYGLRFFKEPVMVYIEEIENFQHSSKEKFCVLVLLVLFNNALRVHHLLKNDDSTKKFNCALTLCRMSERTPLHTLRKTLDTITGYYVKKIGDEYQFCHDLVMEVTSYVFGRDYPRNMIKYADIGFLRKRVKLEDCNDQNDQLTIYIRDIHLDSLAEKLLKEIVGENLFDVVLNPCLKNKKVADALMRNIEKHKEKIKTLFVKKQFLLDKQNFYQESKDLFFSKLDFMSLNCHISPICALIVFCHSDLSRYCLKALQQLPSNSKDSSLFFAVCCNGAVDLFDMFIKEDIKTFLNDTWGPLYPIHIVSMFHNVEILQKLIQLGVDVNQRNADGDNALMFAVRNIIQESEDNKMNARHYQTLRILLHNKADINLCNTIGDSPINIACQNGHDSTVLLFLNHGADINLCNKKGYSPLHRACKYGHDSTVKLLLDHGAKADICVGNEETPLYQACRSGHDDIVQLILSHRAKSDSCDKLDDNLLPIACAMGFDNIVQLLLKHGANINAIDGFAISPLSNACLSGHYSTVQLLLNHGVASINYDYDQEYGHNSLYFACRTGLDSIVQLLLNWGAYTNSYEDVRDSPLYQACKNGHDSTVKLLLSCGADIDYSDDFGKTPLFAACQTGDDNSVQLLLKHGADVDFRNKYQESFTPLYTACQNGHDSIVELLLNHGANSYLCNEHDGYSPFYKACQNGHDSTVKLLLNHGADINLCNEFGKSLLHTACQTGDDNTVKFLIRQGAKIDLCDEFDGLSPLYTACLNDQRSTVQLLLNQGADINLCDEIGNSLLYRACQAGDDRTVQLLLNNGADINFCNEDGYSPLYRACQNGHDSTVQQLIRREAHVNLCNRFGESPLYGACQNRHVSTVQLLLSNGADVNLNNKFGESPLYIACQNGDYSILQLLLSHGADVNICSNLGYSPLCVACLEGYECIIQLLLNYNVDINLNMRNGLIPVFFAFYMRHYEIIKTLLDAGADTSIANWLGLNYVPSDWNDNDDITGKYLLSKSNIVDNMYDIDSFFSLFVFCQVEELARIK